MREGPRANNITRLSAITKPTQTMHSSTRAAFDCAPEKKKNVSLKHTSYEVHIKTKTRRGYKQSTFWGQRRRYRESSAQTLGIDCHAVTQSRALQFVRTTTASECCCCLDVSQPHHAIPPPKPANLSVSDLHVLSALRI